MPRKDSSKRLIAAAFLAALALFTWLLRSQRHASRDQRVISGLQFNEIDGIVQNGLSETELNRYSRSVEGTRVRWHGKIVDIDPDGTVYVAVSPASGTKPNAQFKLAGSLAQTLKRDQEIKFTGTIEKVGILETFPPMPNTYVFLRDVKLQ